MERKQLEKKIYTLTTRGTAKGGEQRAKKSAEGEHELRKKG